MLTYPRSQAATWLLLEVDVTNVQMQLIDAHRTVGDWFKDSPSGLPLTLASSISAEVVSKSCGQIELPVCPSTSHSADILLGTPDCQHLRFATG